MKYTSFATALLLSTAAMAQDKPEDAPAPPAEVVAPHPPMFYFELLQQGLIVLNEALQGMPYRAAAPLLLKMNKQLEVQAKIMANRDEARAKDEPKKPKGK